MPDLPDLTPKQRRFVEEYLVDLNATQAAIRAGYSAKTAEQQGSRLLSNAKVKAAIEVGQAKISERTGITTDWVAGQLRDIAKGKDTPAAAKVSALTQLGKHTGGFSDRAEVEHKGELTVVIRTFGEGA